MRSARLHNSPQAMQLFVISAMMWSARNLEKQNRKKQKSGGSSLKKFIAILLIKVVFACKAAV
ncbi:MAG: hypothetical protein K2H30_05030 [Clostridia bacterium]|nr:hypothetical protein [Clostridia bacterium]